MVDLILDRLAPHLCPGTPLPPTVLGWVNAAAQSGEITERTRDAFFYAHIDCLVQQGLGVPLSAVVQVQGMPFAP